MDLTRRYVCFFVLLRVFWLGKVLSCQFPSGERTKCKDVSSQQDCPRTCCFDTTTTPNCYFQKNAYGPIQHSNGLCINVKDDKRTLIWSRDCTSANAFFLVSYHYPAYHVVTGKCVLPQTNAQKTLDDPGDTVPLFLTSNQLNCKRDTVTYRLGKNGNLEYFYSKGAYELCVGTMSSDEPRENDKVFIRKTFCLVDNTCKLNYVNERKFFKGEEANFQCESCSVIEIIWANYGVQVSGQYPLTISSTNEECVTINATNVMKGKCNGKTQCFFRVQSHDFLKTTCTETTILLIRYKCIPAAPSMLSVVVESQTDLVIYWSNDNNNARFKVCWKNAVKKRCNSTYFWSSQPSIKIPNLQPATKYTITVARYNGNILGHKRQKDAITRSAPLQTTGKKSATSFQIKLRTLQSSDIYAQIVVQQTHTKPTNQPENDLKPHSGNSADTKPYITAELGRESVNQNRNFIVGDDQTYTRSGRRTRRNSEFHNVKLQPDTYYSVFQRTFKSSDLYYDSDWMDVIKTDIPLPTTSPLTGRQKTTFSQPMDNNNLAGGEKNGESSGGVSTAIIGVAAAGSVLLIVLVILVIIFVRRRQRGNSSIHLYEKPMKTIKPKQTDLNEEHIHQTDSQPSDKPEENPDVFTAPSGDVYAKPIKKRQTLDSEDGDGLQNPSYANMQDDILADESDGVEISRFFSYVEEMKKNKNSGFQNEFKKLPVGQIHPWDVGKMAKNVRKNKYGNNTAYDHSRVVLSGAQDYINANFIKGINAELYIAAQGPTEETVNDFWRMIWEKDCTCVIALTNIVELGKVKCFQYWADDETSFGEIHVKTVKTQLFADFTLRFLDIKKDGKGKKIIQYHFTSWPDHGVPKYPTKLLAFRHRFRALHTRSTQPIVVHCSAGVGRTGTFIALDMALLRLNQLNEQTINIKETINELRNQRINMVQTLEQYIFLHDGVLEMLHCGLTEIVAENLKTEIERLEQKELNKSLTGFEIEFKNLASACHALTPEECKAALLQENKSKNRDSKIYPTENLRVYLCGTNKEQDPYINATYVHSYTEARAYIATQAPLPHTINDFWQMVFEQKTVVVVMLNNIKEGDTIYPQYWPEDFNEEQNYGDLFVKMVSAETRGPIVSRKFVITNTNKKATVTEHVVRHVQFTDWPENGIPENHGDVMELLDSVETQQRSGNGAVIIHCSNGAHRTGTYLTLAIQRERVSTEHVIDIFRCTKMLREQRPQFVGNLEQYKFCYYAMLTFVESFKTYDNIPKLQKEF